MPKPAAASPDPESTPSDASPTHAQENGARTGVAFTRESVDARIDALDAERADARRKASARLAQRGFIESVGDGADAAVGASGPWCGALIVPGIATPVPATVALPPKFPDVLPRVSVNRADLPRRLAHVEEDGHVCVIPSSGVLLDADRPAALVDEALDRAARELARGVSGESDDDLQSEWLAYWQPTDAARTYMICRATGPARQIVTARANGPAPLGAGVDLLAESGEEARRWAQRLGGAATATGSAFFVPFVSVFPPPDFGIAWSVRDVLTLIDTHSSPADAAALRQFLNATTLPAIVAMSLPEAPAGTGRRLIAVRVEKLEKDAAKAAANGFRPGHVPMWRRLQVTAGSAVGRLKLERVDGEYMRARGGAAASLAEATVVVVGVGSVGSEIARNLAALGVGQLRLIDADVVGPENVHRHVLGVRQLWRFKASALAEELSALFPHLSIEGVPRRVEDVLMDGRDQLLDADLIVVAVGDETLERRLNRLMAVGPPRVHAWVEPLGVGGHALACALRDHQRVVGGGAGCYECLFVLDEVLGRVNTAALTAPGQEIRLSLAGCIGTFSPFSALDARRTALEAAELGAAILTGALTEASLLTWRGERTAFEQAGYRLSRRAALIGPAARIIVPGHEFARAECTVCGAQGVA